MKRIRMIGMGGVFLLVASLGPSWALQPGGQGDQQRDKQGKRDQSQGQQGRPPQGPPPQQQRGPQGGQSPREQGRPQQPQPSRQSPQQRQGNQQQGRQQPPQRSEQQARAWQQNRGWQQRDSWQGRGTWQQNRAQRWESEHRTWTQRGGYGGYYIPKNRFSVSFGPQHLFRIRTRPSIYMGYPQFSYGGYSFLMVDPWPEYWSENWYDSDDVYVDYDDGYYLHNRRYPQVRLAITIRL